MKTFTKKSMALLLAVLMMLSCVVTGTFAFTASAEEAAGEEVAYEAALFRTASDGETLVPYEVGGVAQTGTFVDMVNLGASKSDSWLTVKLYKDVEIDTAFSIKSKTISTIDGQGHTIYMGKELLESMRNTGDNTNYIFKLWVFAQATFDFTVKNLTLNGQPKDWDGTAASATYFGNSAENKHGAAFVISKYAHFTMDNCRMENFYTYTKGSCITVDAPNARADIDDTLGQRGIWLNDTVMTNNHHLGNTVGANATVIRGRSDQVGTEIHISGNTYIDNNYDKNGNPSANVFAQLGNYSTKDATTGQSTYIDNECGSITVYVASDFTGSVGITGTTLLATDYTEVFTTLNEGTGEYEVTNEIAKTMRASVIFEDSYNPLDGGFVYAWRGSGASALRSLCLPEDATKTSNVKILKAESANAFIYRDGEWSNATWINTAFNDLKTTADESEATTVEERLAEAANTLLVLTGDGGKGYGGSSQYRGLYTVYGNGHVVSSSWDDTWGGLPMFRFGPASSSDENKAIAAKTAIIFKDIILDGNIDVTVGDDGYLEFDKISTTDVEINAIGAGSGNGGGLEINQAGIYIGLENVEIRNFVQNRCNWSTGASNDKRFGAALYDTQGGEWHLNNVSIHDNYTGENSVPVHMSSANARVYLSGNIEMYNNYATKYAKTGDATSADTRKASVVDNFTIVNNYDVNLNSPNTLILDGTAKSDSIIMKNYTSEGTGLARLEEGAELGVAFKNSVNTTFQLYVEAAVTDGYHKVTWVDPENMPTEVTLTVLGTDNETVVVDDWKVTVKGGDELPTANGLTWYNGETATATHIKGVTSYVGKWSESTTRTNMASYDNRQTWLFNETLECLGYTETIPTDVELLEGYVFTTSYTIPYKSSVVVDGNGFTSTVMSGFTKTNILATGANATTQTTKTFKNFNFDGTGFTTIGAGSGIFQPISNSGTWVFDNCKFSNCVGAGNAGVFRPTGATTMVLRDVIFENCSGTDGAIRAGFAGTLGPVIRLEGNTTIKGGKNRIYLYTHGAIAVSADFTGEVDVYGSTMSTVDNKSWTTVDRVVASYTYADKAVVAEGATITGKIWNTNSTATEDGYTLRAYDNNGILCWGDEAALAKVAYTFDYKGGIETLPSGRYDIGTELPIPAKADFSGETPKFWGSEWYYDDAEGNPVQTTVTVAGFTSYYVGEWSEAKSLVEAYVDEDNYGLLVDVVADAVAGDRVEIIKDLSLAEKVQIISDITVDGNGYTLTFAVDEDGKAINRDFMFGIGANRKVLLTDIVMDGGGTPGVWGQAIQAAGKGFVTTGSASRTDPNYGVTYNNCTFKGLRMYQAGESQTAIYVNGMRTTFTGNTVITDNMFRAAQYVLDGSATEQFPTDENGNYIDATNLNCKNSSGAVVSAPTAKLGAIIRCDGSTALYIKDNFQSYNNYGIYVTVTGEGEEAVSEDTFVRNCEITTGGSTAVPGYKRIVVGPLADTANLYINGTQGYSVALDENGVPYPIADQVKFFSAGEEISYNYIVSAHNPNAADVAADLALHTSVGGDQIAIYRAAEHVSFVGGESGSQVGGNLASDKLTLDVYVTLKANPSETLKLTVGDVVISEKTLAEYGTPITRRTNSGDTYGWYKISIDLGMAQLTDTIKFQLLDAEGNSKGSFSTSAKAYIDTLLATETFETTAVSVEALKNALVSLLEYGTMAQLQFNYNTDALANDGDYSAYTYNQVTAKALTFSDASQVKATKSGSLDGVTLLGSSLILDNQVSMRIYVTVDDATKYTFTIGETPYELQTGKNGSYIEVANIGTADLGKFVTLTIAPVEGEGSLTYTVSPMSYVYSVNKNASQAVNLKNVCEGMFYYYDAVMNAYGLEQSITYTVEAELATASDEPNAYSVPFGIEG